MPFPCVLVSSMVVSLIVIVPAGLKWRLDARVLAAATAGIGAASCLLTALVDRRLHLGLSLGLLVEVFLVTVIWAGLLAWRFYRDPERKPADVEGVILSPADGTVIYVRKVQGGEIPVSEKNGKACRLVEFARSDLLRDAGWLVGISMTFLDVHVNRAPVAGRVILLKHSHGAFLSLRRDESSLQNERVTTIIEAERTRVGVVQIASRLVRRIVPCVAEGAVVTQAQRIGRITFGSQVDVVLEAAPQCQVVVRQGQKVKAGLSTIARFESAV